MSVTIGHTTTSRDAIVVPDRRWLYVFAYVVLWTVQALLIKGASRRGADEPQYPYEIMAMTIAIESFKLVVALSVFLFTSQDSLLPFVGRLGIIKAKFHDGLFLIIPAATYGLYNGLQFVNLRLMEPATYRVLINIRIIFSGLLLQLFFRKLLTPRQWLALLLLIAACVVEQLGSFNVKHGAVVIVTVGLQGLCSSLGGVFFQWMLQRSVTSTLWLKNSYLYFWSIIVNIVAIIIFRPELLVPSALFVNFDGYAAAIVVIAGLGGVSTSLLLRHLDVLIKEYANFAEMVVVAVAQRALFATPIRPTLLAAIAMVSYSLYMYQTPAPIPHATKAPVELVVVKEDSPLLKRKQTV